MSYCDCYRGELQRNSLSTLNVIFSVTVLKHYLFSFYNSDMIKNANTLLLSSVEKRNVKQYSGASGPGKGSQKYEQLVSRAKWDKLPVSEGWKKSSKGFFFGLNIYHYISDTCQLISLTCCMYLGMSVFLKILLWRRLTVPSQLHRLVPLPWFPAFLKYCAF